jgi:hypothetical protein
MKIIKKVKARIAFTLAVRRAEDAHAKDSDRYFVLPSGDGKLVIVDKMNFKRLKRKHYVGRNHTPSRLIDECFYYTANCFEGGMDKERVKKMRRSYTDWVTNLPKLKEKVDTGGK